MFHPAILRLPSEVLAPDTSYIKGVSALTQASGLEVAQEALCHEPVSAKVKSEVSVLKKDTLRLRELLSRLVKENLCKLVQEGQLELCYVD